ncbi:MAG: hypothetical protein IJY39_09190 [Clostridia bacterium]|nr:hypothetical protein [Clostridia bacterium]
MENIKEGTFYKEVEIEGVVFKIYYGYVNDEERYSGWEPTPLYPIFEEHPQYTPRGYPFATAYQDCCPYYEPIRTGKQDNKWCFNCKLFDKREKYIGICTCEKRKLEVARSGTQTDSPSEKTEVRGDKI